MVSDRCPTLLTVSHQRFRHDAYGQSEEGRRARVCDLSERVMRVCALSVAALMGTGFSLERCERACTSRTLALTCVLMNSWKEYICTSEMDGGSTPLRINIEPDTRNDQHDQALHLLHLSFAVCSNLVSPR